MTLYIVIDSVIEYLLYVIVLSRNSCFPYLYMYIILI